MRAVCVHCKWKRNSRLLNRKCYEENGYSKGTCCWLLRKHIGMLVVKDPILGDILCVQADVISCDHITIIHLKANL